jgi:hypothetical protein
MIWANTRRRRCGVRPDPRPVQPSPTGQARGAKDPRARSVKDNSPRTQQGYQGNQGYPGGQRTGAGDCIARCARQVQQIGHGKRARLSSVQEHIPLFDRTRTIPSSRPAVWQSTACSKADTKAKTIRAANRAATKATKLDALMLSNSILHRTVALRGRPRCRHARQVNNSTRAGTVASTRCRAE